jgi:predicted TIM-barrel fold metal-dependent hydrolase
MAANAGSFRYSYVALFMAILPCSALSAVSMDVEDMPKIDAHAHIYAPMPEMAAMLKRLNFKVINICDGGNDPELFVKKRAWVQAQHEAYPARFAFCPTFDLTRRAESDYGAQVTRYFDEAFESGAVMIKIYKEVGLEIKDGNGAYVMADAPLFDPVYKYLSEKRRPLLAHLAEPRVAWLPLDPESVHYGYYSRHPEWHFYVRDDVPSWEQIIDARSRLLMKHPDLTMIGAHLGSMAYDVDVLGTYLDRFPNFHVDIAARTGDLSRQSSEKVRAFFVKYQDRVLYGSDIEIWPKEDVPRTSAERAKSVRDAENHYRMTWQYYTGTGTVTIKGKETICLNLPSAVVKKFYYKNAVRLMPGL